MRRISIGAVCVVAVLCCGGGVRASGGAHLLVQPGTKKIELAAGEVWEDSLRVKNTGAMGYAVRLYVEPFFVDENYENVYSENNFTQISRWVELPQDEYYVEAGESVQVPYSVRVPEDAAGGGQYCAIFAEVVGEGGMVQVVNRVGAVLYATVDGETRRGGWVEYGDVGFWQREGSVSLPEVAVNGGNVDYEIATEVVVRNWLTGAEVEAEVVRAVEKMVLPGTRREVEHRVDGLRLGLYVVERKAEIFGELYASEQVILVMPVVYVVLQLMLVVGVVLLVVGRIVRKRRRHITNSL